ncbi:MAG: hypothetical protein KAS17_04185 [Victivallaceae bacterium]|nr:hypothetical protein [Victivallaceae bacterium]
MNNNYQQGLLKTTSKKPLKVIICAGQSNMTGDGKVSELPEELKHKQPDTLCYNDKKWLSMEPGKNSSVFGPELSFAREINTKLKEPIGIIKHTAGSTNLAVDWSPRRSESLYQELLAKVNVAKETCNIKIVAMLWMQGERDTRQKKWANAYARNLTNLIKTARQDFGNPEMVFIAGRVNPPNRPLANIVREAQENIKLDKYAWIDCDDLDGAENIHYASNGYIEMGRKFATALIPYLEIK